MRSLACFALLLALSTLPAGAAGDKGVFEFTELNKSYSQLDADLAPVASGPLTIHLSSPRHEVVLKRNRLELTPRPDGSYDIVLSLDFRGSGELVADLDVAGARSHIEDLLELPAQRRTLAGRVRLERSDEGYLATVVELPESFEVAIKSKVGQRLVTACRPLALLALSAISCKGLEQALSYAAIPMPEAGSTYLVEEAQLSPESRRRLDHFLAQGSGPGPRPGS